MAQENESQVGQNPEQQPTPEERITRLEQALVGVINLVQESNTILGASSSRLEGYVRAINRELGKISSELTPNQDPTPSQERRNP